MRYQLVSCYLLVLADQLPMMLWATVSSGQRKSSWPSFRYVTLYRHRILSGVFEHLQGTVVWFRAGACMNSFVPSFLSRLQLLLRPKPWRKPGEVWGWGYVWYISAECTYMMYITQLVCSTFYWVYCTEPGYQYCKPYLNLSWDVALFLHFRMWVIVSRRSHWPPPLCRPLSRELAVLLEVTGGTTYQRSSEEVSVETHQC